MPWLNTKTFDSESKYNPAELNRVNTNIQYLKDWLDQAGFSIPLPQPVVTNYSRTNFPYVSAINNARENLKALVDGFYDVGAPAIVVDTTRLQLFDYIKANVLEQNLQGVFDVLDSIVKSFKYSGTFYAGQDIIL